MGARGQPRRAGARGVRAPEDRALNAIRLAAGFLAALAAWLAAPCALGQTAQEHEVKAAFLVKFPAFVDWPAEAFARPDAPFVFGVYGGDDVAAELRQMAQGRSVHGRPVAVRRLAPNEGPAGVHIAFVGRSESARLPALARAAQGQPLLIVAESEGALDQGAMINFLPANGRVRFEVAVDAAERSRLRISSRMLAVAVNVRPAR